MVEDVFFRSEDLPPAGVASLLIASDFTGLTLLAAAAAAVDVFYGV